MDLIDELLSMYIETQTQAADELAQEIEKKSDAIAEINRLWGQIMIDGLDGQDPDDFGPAKDGTTYIGGSIVEQDPWEIDKIICDFEGLTPYEATA